MAEIQGTKGPFYYEGMQAKLAKLAHSSGYFGSVTHVAQIERMSDTDDAGRSADPLAVNMLLTERVLEPGYRPEVGGITRVLGTNLELTHEEMHACIRAYMINARYLMDFGPLHCDVNNREGQCMLYKADDNWYEGIYIPTRGRNFKSQW